MLTLEPAAPPPPAGLLKTQVAGLSPESGMGTEHPMSSQVMLLQQAWGLPLGAPAAEIGLTDPVFFFARASRKLSMSKEPSWQEHRCSTL